jgi:hypothetical protein
MTTHNLGVPRSVRSCVARCFALACGLVLHTLLAGGPASAQAQWNEVSKARNGDVWAMEAGTARRAGDSARVWVLINHPLPITNPAPYAFSGVRSFRALVQIDCKEQRARRLEASYFSQPNGDGRLLGTSENDDWFNVPPDTPDADLMKAACDLPDQAPVPPATPAGAAPAAPARPPGARG